MKAPEKKIKNLEDQDIVRVFGAQHVDVPDDLKNDIFAEAERQAESIVASEANRHNSRTSAKLMATNRWFGIAATVVVAVAVSPLLFNSPESALDIQGGVASSTAAEMGAVENVSLEVADELTLENELLAESTREATPAATAELSSSPTPLVDTTAASINSDSMSTDQEEQFESRNEGVNMKQAVRPESDLLSSDASIASAPSQAIVEVSPIESITSAASSFKAPSTAVSAVEQPPYRTTPEKWMSRIRMLITDADAKAAREEYRLFAEQHPELAQEFKPEFEKQMLELVPDIDTD